MVEQEQPASCDAVRAELSRILGAPHLDASERNRSFPCLVVEEVLAGRTDRIEARAIALEARSRLEPNDGTSLAGLGQRCAMRARWYRAVPPLEAAYVTNPGRPGSYRIGGTAR